MTVEDVFAEVNAHMIQGLMVHSQMANYYGFLGLKGYSKCHLYHYWMEGKCHVKLMEYYFKYHNKLIKDMPVEDPKLIPKSWYNYEMKDVDITTKRNAVKAGMEKWVEWEENTVKTFKKAYKDLLSLGAVEDANYIMNLLEEAREELSEVKYWHMMKIAQDFEIGPILAEQDKKQHKYKKKIHKHCCCCE